jgi:hypothetical protein
MDTIQETEFNARTWSHGRKESTMETNSILVLAFTRSTIPTLFKNRSGHVDVEMFLVPTPPPSGSETGKPAKSYEFDRRHTLAVHVDTSTGMKSDFRRLDGLSSQTHDTICIPLTRTEKDRIIDFVHRTRSCKYNAWDAMLCQTAPVFTPFLTTVTAEQLSNYGTIKKLHAGQFATLIIQICIDDKNRLKSKMWGYNSRITTANEIYREINGSCMAINPDALRSGYVQAWGVGISRSGPNHC